MANCKNSSNDFWASKINGVADAQITIDTEDGAGNCSGHHLKGGVQTNIKGKCTGRIIWLLQPDNSPDYIYVGEFRGADHIEGVRFTLATLFSRPLLAGPDDWTGDKTVTLKDRAKKGTSKKAAGKKAATKKKAS